MRKKALALSVTMVLSCAGASAALAAPVTYSFSTQATATGGPSSAGGPAPDVSLFAGGASGTFVYDSAATFASDSANGTIWRGFTPASVTGFATSLSNLSGSVGGMVFSDVSGATLVGNDSFGTTLVDVFQFLFDPGLTSTSPRNYSGLNIDGFTNIGLRMFWIEGQQITSSLSPIPDFLLNDNLLASPPSFTGRLAFDFIVTGNPNLTSFIFLDGLTVQPVIAAIPEPETYALMLAGLGLLGFAARRRSR